MVSIKFAKKTRMPGNNENFLVQVNQFVFNITVEQLESSEIISRSATEFHIIHNHRSARAKVHDPAPGNKKLRVEIDGETFDVEIKDQLDQMLEKMGFGMAAGKPVEDVRAPMPGLVVQVSVTEGQEVKEGEPVLVLEAMKMENSITLHGNARIKKVHVKRGDSVDKGQVLIELE